MIVQKDTSTAFKNIRGISDSFYLLKINSGCLEALIDGQLLKFGKDSILALSPMTLYKFEVPPDTEYSGVTFSKNSISSDAKKLVDQLKFPQLFISETAVGLLERILHPKRERVKEQETLRRQYLFLELLYELSTCDQIETPSKSNSDDYKILTDVLKNHLHGDLKARELTELTGLSPYRAKNAISSVYGLTPKEFLTEMRLNATSYLIREEGYTVKEARIKHGFHSAATYYRQSAKSIWDSDSIKKLEENITEINYK